MSIACYIPSDSVYRQVQEVLAGCGFDSERFTDEISLLRALRNREYILVLFESGKELISGDSIASWLNCRNGEATPVVLLSSATGPEHMVKALESGADEFISMPFDPRELAARLQAVLRSYRRNLSRRRIKLAGFHLDIENSILTDQGVPVELTPREFAMAWLFFSSPGAFLSREAIAAAVWGVGSDIASRTIEQHVYKLRKKLQLSIERGVHIRTAYTRGYRLEVCAPDDQQADDALTAPPGAID